MRAAPIVLILLGCTGGVDLIVDVRTDLIAGTDADEVRCSLAAEDGVPLASDGRTLDLGVDLLAEGQRACELTGLGAGHRDLVVELRLAGAPVVDRALALDLAETTALTVVLTRSCRGVVCPEPGGSRDATTCESGRCVVPFCPPPCATELACDDGSDDDGDTQIDCADSDCLGRACGSGSVCLPDRECHRCGGNGEICCASSGCDSGLVCGPAGSCQSCGGNNESCCESSGCDAGLICALGSCRSCGGNEEACCAGATCDDMSLVCTPDMLCRSCGATGQPCCAGQACVTGQVCLNGACLACGARFAPCCPGSSCDAALTCTFGMCS